MDVRDTAAKEERLERWVADQRGKTHGHELTRRSLVRLRWAGRLQRLANRFFDRDLDTLQGSIEPEHEQFDRIHYVASDWHVLPRALRRIGVSHEDVFLDLGCGKGRVVHQAAKRPFRRVIGVEISPVLAEEARRMLAAHSDRHRCRNVEIVVADAADYRIPDDLTILYIFHPFHDPTFSKVLERIVESLDRNPRRLRLIYCYPSHSRQVLETERFRLLKEQRSRLLDTYTARTQIFESV